MESIHPLKAHRKITGLTQRELAGRLGVTRETLARWETGRKIEDELVPRVSEKTGIPVAKLRPDLVELLNAGTAVASA